MFPYAIFKVLLTLCTLTYLKYEIYSWALLYSLYWLLSEVGIRDLNSDNPEFWNEILDFEIEDLNGGFRDNVYT